MDMIIALVIVGLIGIIALLMLCFKGIKLIKSTNNKKA